MFYCTVYVIRAIEFARAINQNTFFARNSTTRFYTTTRGQTSRARFIIYGNFDDLLSDNII